MNEQTESLIIPSEFYFQTTFEIPFQDDLEGPITGGDHPQVSVPLPYLMFERAGNKPLGTVYVAWNDHGIAINAELELPQQENEAEGSGRPELDLFIDTRDMKSNKRVNRFCHHFQLLFPAQGVKKLLPERIKQIALTHTQSKNSADARHEIPTVGTIQGDRQIVSCWLSKKVLNGFDPKNVPSIGFFYLIKPDRPQADNQPYGLSEDFPYAADPSLWPSLKLHRS